MVEICIPTVGLWVMTFVDLGLWCMLIFGFVGLWCMLYSDVDFWVCGVHGGRKSGFEFCVFCVWFQSIRKSC